VITLSRSILERTKAEVDNHIPTRVPKERVAKAFSFVKPICHPRVLVHLVREDHVRLELPRETSGDEITCVVESAVTHHDLAHDWKDAEELL